MPTRRRAAVPTSAEIAKMARQQKMLDQKAKDAAEKRDLIKPKLVAAMQRFGAKVLESGGVRVVLSEPTVTEYDEGGIFTTLDAKQRKEAFDEVINISLLPPAERKELNRKLQSLLTPAQRKRCTEQRFNLDRMSQAVQQGKIPIEVLDAHTRVVHRTPYTTVTLK